MPKNEKEKMKKKKDWEARPTVCTADGRMPKKKKKKRKKWGGGPTDRTANAASNQRMKVLSRGLST